MKFRNLFWGIILIFVGTLAILNNLDVIDFAWRKLWNLWPVFLMLWGISILPIKDGIRLGLVVITLGLTMYYISDQAVFTGNESYSNNGWSHGSADFDFDNEDEDSVYEYDSANNPQFLIPFTEGLETATLNFDAVAGHYILKNSTGNLVNFDLDNNQLANIYRYSVKTEGNNARVNIDTKKHNHFKLNDKKNYKGILKLNENPLWVIDIDAGATKLNFDLEKFKVKKLSVDAGAADIDITVGDKYPDVKVSIDAGASSITIRVPEGSGCKVNMDTFLADKTLSGFNKIDGKYVTSNYDEAENKIYINLNSAVSSVKIVRY